MADLELKTNAPGLDKVIGQMGQLSKAEQRAALNAVGMGRSLDRSTKKGKKDVSSLEKGIGKVGSRLLAIAGPSAIFATFIAKARADFEHIVKMADKAKNQNVGFASAQADLFTNDRMFKGNKKLQLDFDNLFKDQGKRSEGLVNKLPSALAGARSQTGALKIAQDPEFLKEAIISASNSYVATQGKSDVQSDIVSIAQIAERDTRNVSAKEKVISAEAQKAEFQAQSATDATAAAAIIPKVLSSFVNFGSKEQILATQSFATNQGLSQDGALAGLSQLDSKLADRKEFKDFKGTGFERMQEAAKLLKAGKININDFKGGEKPILNAMANSPEMLQGFANKMQGAQNTKTSASLDNLAAQEELNPALKKLVDERAAKGTAEVKALQDTEGSDYSATRATGNADLEGAGSSGSQIGVTNTVADAGKFLGADNKKVENLYEFSKLNTLAGRGTLDLINPFEDLTNDKKGREELRRQTIEGTLSGKLIKGEDGLNKTEQDRLRFAGAGEDQISELNRLQKTDNAKMIEKLGEVVAELKAVNAKKNLADFLDPSNKKQLTPGEDDL